MDLGNIRSVYFIGAGGIGMSALVRFFLSKGKFVAGYDRTSSELTNHLIEEGAHIHFTDDCTLIPQECMNKDHTLVVMTPAIPQTHSELCFFQHSGFHVMKRAQALGIITKASEGLCIAGTHGKTTTSTLLAHLLHQSHVGCTAFLGGISQNYHTNLLLHPTSPLTVIEADEFDRSFHWLEPTMAVITAVDADHLDIYGTYEAYQESFVHFTSLIRPGGTLLLHEGVNLTPQVQESVKIYTYSRNKGDFHAEHERIGGGEIVIDFVGPNIRINDIKLGVPISINIENSVAAMALAHLNGLSPEEIRCGMESFRGVERRFDFKLKTTHTVVLTDYAHHPKEIRQSILSLRELYPTKKLTGVFQPHLYTRTRDFYKEFAESLSLLDEVILTEIYPAREQPIEGVNSQLIAKYIEDNVKTCICPKEKIADLLHTKDIEVLVVLGAGDIDCYVPSFIKAITSEK